MSEQTPERRHEELGQPAVAEQHVEQSESFDTEALRMQQEAEEQEKAALKESIVALGNEMPAEQLKSEKEGTEFVPAVPAKKASIWKKAAVFGGMALGLFSTQNTYSQEKKNSDKDGVKKEIVKTPEYTQELTAKEKADWGEYVRYVKTKHLHEDPRINTRVFASKTLRDFIAEHPGTSLDEEKVVQIQAEFAKLREWILGKVKNKEMVNGRLFELADGVSEEEFMKNLSRKDGIAGQQTLREFPLEYEQMIREMRIHLNSNKDIQYASVESSKPVAKGFLSRGESK